MNEASFNSFLMALTLPDGSILGDWPKSFSLQRDENHTQVEVYLPFPCLSHHDALLSCIEKGWHALGGGAIQIRLVHRIRPCVTQPEVKSIQNVIAVASAKGGVGKSTIALNLAMALKKEGARVGILDADIYGPSLPLLVTERPSNERAVGEEVGLPPVSYQGLQTMSIGFLLNSEESPLVWRGPMASRALVQLFFETQWSELDYLVVDLPPGTGDIQLTLAQKIPISGALIVTTPHELSLADAKKGINMFRKVQVPVLGVLENMSYHTCHHCHEKAYLFGQSGGKHLAEQFNLPLLGEVPLSDELQATFHRQEGSISKEKNGSVAELIFEPITYEITSALAKLALKTRKFPKIVIEQ